MSDWQKQLVDGLKSYTDDVTKGVKEEVASAGKEAITQLKQTSPRMIKGKKKGKYAKGWRLKKTRETATESVVTVHNKTDYQLTHILEHGHKNRDGGFTAARPHIAAAEEAASKNLERKITILLKG